MPERRGLRSSISRRVGQVLRTTLVRPPCPCGVSKAKTHNKDRRLDKESLHRIRPIVTPTIFSFLSCDDIMILNAENLATREKVLSNKALQK